MYIGNLSDEIKRGVSFLSFLTDFTLVKISLCSPRRMHVHLPHIASLINRSACFFSSELLLYSITLFGLWIFSRKDMNSKDSCQDTPCIVLEDFYSFYVNDFINSLKWNM